MSANLAVANKPSLLAKMAGRFGVEADKMMVTLKSTVFKGEVSNEQMMMLLIVADQYNLNPFTRELFAFDDKRNGIVPVVSIDGWARIINEHPQFDGMEFEYGPANEKGTFEWIECAIYRKDRSLPTRIREFFKEVYRDTQPWKSHPSRMLRHKAMIQCARVAFSFAGIYDEDEAQRIIEKDVTPVENKPRIAMPQPKKQAEKIIDNVASEIVDIDSSPEIAGAGTRTIDDVPLTEGELNLIKNKMQQATVTEVDLHAAFGMRLADLTSVDFEPVMDWIKNPMGDASA